MKKNIYIQNMYLYLNKLTIIGEELIMSSTILYLHPGTWNLKLR